VRKYDADSSIGWRHVGCCIVYRKRYKFGDSASAPGGDSKSLVELGGVD